MGWANEHCSVRHLIKGYFSGSRYHCENLSSSIAIKLQRSNDPVLQQTFHVHYFVFVKVELTVTPRLKAHKMCTGYAVGI